VERCLACEADSVGNRWATKPTGWNSPLASLKRLLSPVLAADAIHAFRKAAVFQEAFCQASKLAVEEGAGDCDQHECGVGGDFCVSRSAAVMAETGADFSDPKCYVFGAGAACVDKLLAERLVVGPFL